MSAFKAYDFRGVFGKDFTLEEIYRIGFYLPKLLNVNKVLIGRDMRTSSPAMFESLTAGITDAGADVYDMGLTTTPMVYYFTAKHGFDASVMITASHNPKEHNGLKVSRTNALPVGYDSGLGEREKMIQVTPQPSGAKGKVIPHDVKAEYIAFQKQFSYDISNLKIAMDCSNGMASILVRDLFGDAPTYLYDELDGTFPHHEANPLEIQNVRDLQALVVKEKADIGVIYDGDADRVMFVDDKARFVAPDLIIALMAYYFCDERGEKNPRVLQEIRSSKAVGEFLAGYGAEMHTWRVGRAFAAPKLREIDGLWGGELAGHYYFKDFFYSDSGMLASIIVLRIVSALKKKGLTLSGEIDKLTRYRNSGEINFRVEDKKGAMDAVRDHFFAQAKPDAFMDFDGYRAEYPDWWFNIRPSNTEPYLRFICEATTDEVLNRKIAEVQEIIETRFGGTRA